MTDDLLPMRAVFPDGGPSWETEVDGKPSEGWSLCNSLERAGVAYEVALGPDGHQRIDVKVGAGLSFWFDSMGRLLRVVQ